VCKKLIKNSQPFGKKFQKTVGGDFFDSHCICLPYIDIGGRSSVGVYNQNTVGEYGDFQALYAKISQLIRNMTYY